MEELIIDTDPGVDDALAIMYAIKAGCNINGITSVFGNSDIENTTMNALRILSIMGKNIPIYKGSSAPLIIKSTLATSHGVGGFGGCDIKVNAEVNTLDAISFLINKVERSVEKLSIICLGPTTNLAKLKYLSKNSLSNLGEVIILGGAVGERGNISPYAEFNVFNDPHALEEVLGMDLNPYLIPIDVCRKVYFTLEDFNVIDNPDVSSSIKSISRQYIEYYQNDQEYGKFAGGVMYDLLATALYTNKELFTFREAHIDVETSDLPNIGQTTEDKNRKPNCRLITGVNSAKLKELFFSTMNR